MPTGITGLARPREWDATTSVELPEFVGETDRELVFFAFPTELASTAQAPLEALERIADALDAEVERPYQALAVRRSDRSWAAAARRVNAELILLPELAAESVEVARPPDGETVLSLDGLPADGPVAPEVADAFREVEARARARFQAFAARADNLGGGRWKLTIDPL